MSEEIIPIEDVFKEQEIVKVEEIDLVMIEAQERALMDTQIVTAKRYPRNIQLVQQNIVALVSMSEEVARTASYALPRKSKGQTVYIKGASVHLARMVAQQYKNIRVDSRVSNIDKTHITGQATCIDLENNVGIRVEVKRRITNKDGIRYNDDMITMTGNAAIAIALRNAVFNVVPKALVDAGYKAAQNKLIGDLSDEQKLLAKRKKVLDEFLKSYGVKTADILRTLSLREETEIGAEEIHTLLGVWQAINDGDSTVDQIFFPNKNAPADKGVAANELAASMAESKVKKDGKQESQKS